MHIKVTTPDGKEKHFVNAKIINSLITLECQVGVGEPEIKASMAMGDGDVWEEYSEYRTVYKPLINTYLLSQKGLDKEEVTELLEANQEVWKERPELQGCMFQLGENPGGYYVEEFDEEARMKEIRDAAQRRLQKEHPEIFRKAAETGERQIVWKEVMPEKYTPLAKDGENDMVDHVLWANPDGTTSHGYYHNY